MLAAILSRKKDGMCQERAKHRLAGEFVWPQGVPPVALRYFPKARSKHEVAGAEDIQPGGTRSRKFHMKRELLVKEER